MGVMTEADRLKAKVVKQASEIGRLNRVLEEERATKRDHVFRLRKILTGALDGHPGWRALAERELGRENEK